MIKQNNIYSFLLIQSLDAEIIHKKYLLSSLVGSLPTKRDAEIEEYFKKAIKQDYVSNIMYLFYKIAQQINIKINNDNNKIIDLNREKNELLYDYLIDFQDFYLFYLVYELGKAQNDLAKSSPFEKDIDLILSIGHNYQIILDNIKTSFVCTEGKAKEMFLRYIKNNFMRIIQHLMILNEKIIIKAYDTANKKILEISNDSYFLKATNYYEKFHYRYFSQSIDFVNNIQVICDKINKNKIFSKNYLYIAPYHINSQEESSNGNYLSYLFVKSKMINGGLNNEKMISNATMLFILDSINRYNFTKNNSSIKQFANNINIFTFLIFILELGYNSDKNSIQNKRNILFDDLSEQISVNTDSFSKNDKYYQNRKIYQLLSKEFLQTEFNNSKGLIKEQLKFISDEKEKIAEDEITSETFALSCKNAILRILEKIYFPISWNYSRNASLFEQESKTNYNEDVKDVIIQLAEIIYSSIEEVTFENSNG